MTCNGKKESELCAKYAVVTFSVGVLQSKEGLAMFHPPLPPWKLSALGKLDYAYYLKIFLNFSKTFWDNDLWAQPNLESYPCSDANILLFILTEKYA